MNRFHVAIFGLLVFGGLIILATTDYTSYENSKCLPTSLSVRHWTIQKVKSSDFLKYEVWVYLNTTLNGQAYYCMPILLFESKNETESGLYIKIHSDIKDGFYSVHGIDEKNKVVACSLQNTQLEFPEDRTIAGIALIFLGLIFLLYTLIRSICSFSGITRCFLSCCDCTRNNGVERLI